MIFTTVSKNKPHICLKSGFWETDYMRCNLTGCALRNNACEGGKETGRGRERSRTVLQSQQRVQPFSMGVLLSCGPLQSICALKPGVCALYPHRARSCTWAASREGEPGLPGDSSGKEHACQCRRHKRCRFNPWVGKIPWRRTWQSTAILSLGESQRERNLVGYSP